MRATLACTGLNLIARSSSDFQIMSALASNLPSTDFRIKMILRTHTAANLYHVQALVLRVANVQWSNITIYLLENVRLCFQQPNNVGEVKDNKLGVTHKRRV